MIGSLQFEGSTILRSKSVLVESFDENLARLVSEMHHTMQIYGGIGLAAPQVNIPKRIVIFNFEPLVMINPEIVETEGKQTLREGCLSFPQLFLNIERAKKVIAKWQDVYGDYHSGEFTGLEATAIQHEIDHLDGTLFIDHINKMSVMLEKKKLLNKHKGPKR